MIRWAYVNLAGVASADFGPAPRRNVRILSQVIAGEYFASRLASPVETGMGFAFVVNIRALGPVASQPPT
jgi:hypothetical protein